VQSLSVSSEQALISAINIKISLEVIGKGNPRLISKKKDYIRTYFAMNLEDIAQRD